MKLKYSLSSIFVSTAIVGILIAWYLDHRQLARRYQVNTNTLTGLLNDDIKMDQVNLSQLSAYLNSHLVTTTDHPTAFREDATDLLLRAIRQQQSWIISHLERVTREEVK